MDIVPNYMASGKSDFRQRGIILAGDLKKKKKKKGIYNQDDEGTLTMISPVPMLSLLLSERLRWLLSLPLLCLPPREGWWAS